MKGVEAVISAVMLLFIAIAMVGYLYMSINGLTKQTTNITDSRLDHELEVTEKKIAITALNPAARTVTVKGIGKRPVPSSEIAVFVNSATASGIWDPTSIAPGATSVFTWVTLSCAPGQEIKITTTGNYDIATC